jgi:hypothetical protein
MSPRGSGFSCITIESDLLIKHPFCLGAASSIDVPIHQFQNLATQSSYDTPNGFSSFENNSRAYTLCSPENAIKIDKSKENVTKIRVYPPYGFITQAFIPLGAYLLFVGIF